MSTLDRYSFQKTVYTNPKRDDKELDKVLKKLKKKIIEHSKDRHGEICIDVSLCFDTPVAEIKIPVCKLCGKDPAKEKFNSDASGYVSGSATIVCKCGNKVIINCGTMQEAGEDGWQAGRRNFDVALAEAIRQWTIFNG